ncbi:PAS domain S-box-containing protein [Actinoalloteichus hoggarensis]|uniref:Transcriptional regulatory protein ComA n=1 Tax=Actinoalloteichus hoggarensis TaxID=1470176 RepID=A0A221W4E3_9PSEU|nr:LuxR C-terminal-related transcriptional regulator [Actinoalloteichus hoggarensis]ASO20644.1 Transcriptional regulatory protein ComA [Actinoalloteichus hoggarensis]MBB5923685.1 PAS domain S-box-containing protein [Actinoalloteichus hoggarensis]
MTDASSTMTPPRTLVAEGHRSADDHCDVYTSLFQQSGLCMAQLDTHLRVRDASEDFSEQFGRTSAQVRGLNFVELVHPSVRRPLQQHFGRLVEGTNKLFVDRLITVRQQRSAFLGDLRAMAVTEPSGTLKHILVLLNPANDDNRPVRPRKRFMLSPMDAMIVENIASGLSSVTIANKMYLSRQSVEYHVSNLIRELKVSNRTALIAKAYSLGILTSDTWPPRVRETYIK